MVNEWNSEDSKLAVLEGWDLYLCIGSDDGSMQVQRNDEQNLLNNDQEAWFIVKEGKKPHHIKVKQILESPKDISYYNSISY